MDTELEIIISAVDEASATFDEINDSLATVSDVATTMADSTTASFNAYIASVDAAAAATGVAAGQIMADMEKYGIGAQQAADEVVAANSAISISSAEMEDEVAASSSVSSGSFTAVGAAAGLAAYDLIDAISGWVTSAEQWNTTSAAIAQILKDTGSSIPLSQIQAYAQQVQSTTLFTQQSALAAEEQIVSHKQLQGSYESLTMLVADLATKMNTDMPSAAQLLTSALSDPVSAMNKLVKAGINFNAQQVQNIENMAKVGNNAGASAAIIKDLQGSIGGTALAAAQAQGGALIQLGNQFTALGTTIANSGLLTSLDQIAQAMIPIIQNIAQWVEAHPKLTEAIVIGMAAFLAFLAVLSIVGIVMASAASAVVAGAALIAATIAAVIVIIVLNWSAFWTGLQIVTKDATDIIAAIVELVLDGIIVLVTAFSSTITGTLNVMADVVKTITNTLFSDQEKLFTEGVNAISSIWKTGLTGLGTIATDVWNAIGATFKTGIDYVIQAINGFINALDAIHISLPSISIPGTKLATPAVNLGFSIPDIPMLAAGGFVTQPTLALIGESGPEAVIPLSGAGGAAGGQQIIIQIQGGNYLDSQGAQMIASALAKQVLRGMRPVVNYSV